MPCRVARWHILKPKIPFWVNFGAYVLEMEMVYFKAIWSILWPFCLFYGIFGIFFPLLVCFTKKNLATLMPRSLERPESHFSFSRSFTTRNHFQASGQSVQRRLGPLNSSTHNQFRKMGSML
jgi:hypothetical protein